MSRCGCRAAKRSDWGPTAAATLAAARSGGPVPPDAGRVTLDGQDITRMAKSSSPAAWLSVEQHGMTGGRYAGARRRAPGAHSHHSPFSNWSAQDDEAITAALQRVAMLEKSEQGWLSLRRRAAAGAYRPRAGAEPKRNPAG